MTKYRYIGTMYTIPYAHLELELHPIYRDHRKYCFIKPDGRLTTWLPMSDVEVTK